MFAAPEQVVSEVSRVRRPESVFAFRHVNANPNRGLGCAVGFATREQLDQFVESRVACQYSLLR